MRLYKLILVLGVVVVMSSCGQTFKGEIEQIYGDGSPKIVSYYTTDEAREMVRQKVYYPNKQLRIDGFFKNGEKHGKWIYYYEDGVIWSKGFFKNGKIDGFNESFHPNGKLYVKGSFQEGVRVGKWYYYDEEGNLEKEINYDE